MAEVSVIMPVHNASNYLNETLSSLLFQSYDGELELSIFDDASTDSSMEIVKSWRQRLESRGIRVIPSAQSGKAPKGVGYSKNQAIMASSGQYLCFLDADDVMHVDRIKLQHATAQQIYKQTGQHCLIGCRFTRDPLGSTDRYTRWCNSLDEEQLYTQAFTAFGPTLIQPTWFCHRKVFLTAGPYSEEDGGTPEDLIFFYNHLSRGGLLHCVQEELLTYRYHLDSATHQINRWTIWGERVRALEKFILCKWDHFTIWNAGKQGRRLYRSLQPAHREKVIAFCDVDEKKVSQGYYTYEECNIQPRPKVPILHYSQAKPPFILCIKWDLTGGEFEKILSSLELTEGIDYINFS